MIKILIKTLSATLLVLSLIILYLSFFGVKTEKFNDQITNNILKDNKNISLDLNKVTYLLNPYNFTINIKTKNPQILLGVSKLEIKSIKTNISLKSLINRQFSIDDLEITTKQIKLNDIITLVRTFQNSPQLFILNRVLKDGFITVNIKLNFDQQGKVKENYQIKGSVNRARLNILNQFKLKNLSFNFDISKDNYLLKLVDTEFNNTKVISPLIVIKKKDDLFLVKGQILNDNKNSNTQVFKSVFGNLFQNIDIKKIRYSSINDFSFNINNNIKFKDLKVNTVLNLKELIVNGGHLKLKSYFPNFIDEVRLENHKIIIDYSKNKLHINGNGNILIEDRLDNLTYHVAKNDINLIFDSKINLKNNSLLVDFLDYKKREGYNSVLSLKGSLEKNGHIKFDTLSLYEKDNQFLIKGLNLNKDFKIMSIKSLMLNYKNDKNILNKLELKKNNSNIIIEGESFDASRIINNILSNHTKNPSIFHNQNLNINIKIKKTYIDEINYMNNLFGDLSFNNNKIDNLKLKSSFMDGKKINLTIKTNDNSEIITKLFTDYPKPLVRRYDFIKGFEGGDLEFYSIKKDDVSNSVLVINNFKVKKVPIFAKILSLASLQGIADLLTGEGIRFTNFEMNFSTQKGLTTIEEMFAIGPAVSMLMDGYIETKKLISLRGTLVPATTINRSIASIPVLGKILVGDKTGEGVFGVSFKIKGSSENLKTTVNPIKTLTPRFITRTLEKIKNN